jgi:charged multivesicular body protein 1
MENFEKLFEDLDVKTEELNSALEGVYSSAVDQDEVSTLIDQMKEEQGMDIGGGMQGAKQGQIANPNANKGGEVDDLQKRLDELKNL